MNKKNAFSLVELSIVLVILGLLVGGILAGKSLIRASELRSLTASIDQYKTSIYAFRDKYVAFPGDMPNAKSVWPSCTDGTSNNCNGDGDGIVWRYGNSCAYGTINLESLRAWQHLSLAGMVEGDYTLLNANCSGTITNARPGWNVPMLKMDGVGVLFLSSQSTALLNRKILLVGGNYSDSLERSFLLPEEAWNIDTKIDDGVARKGRVWSSNGHTDLAQTNCYSGNDYILTTSERHCRMQFLLD